MYDVVFFFSTGLHSLGVRFNKPKSQIYAQF